MLWGSTSCDRPNVKNYDFRGRDEKIVYEHAIGVDDEENPTVDRRQAVPSCRELFLTVEAEAGECQIRLSVTFGHLKIVLTRSEASAQLRKIRRGWEARVGELQREPGLREQFEEHVGDLEVYVAERRRRAARGHRNFTIENMSQREYVPRVHLEQLRRQALKRCEHDDLVCIRREEHMRDTDRRKANWMNRADGRKRVREERDHERELQRKTEDQQRAWLVKLAVYAFAERTKKASAELRDMQKFMALRTASAGLIQRFICRRLLFMRRGNLYRHACQLRLALAAYARITRPVVFAASQPVLRTFLDTYAYHREAPNLSGTLQRFRARVVLIQKWWEQLRMMRVAYISLFMPSWMEIQDRVYEEMAHKPVDETLEMQAKRLVEQRVHELEAESRKASESRKVQPVRRKTTMKNSEDSWQQNGQKSTSRKTIEIGLLANPVPGSLIRSTLHKYIGQMMRDHKNRVAKWIEEAKRDEYSKDLDLFTSEDGSASVTRKKKTRPRVVYVDRMELGALVKTTVDMWHSPGFKPMRANRVRILRKPFKMWVSTMGQPKVNGRWTMDYGSAFGGAV